MNTPCNLLPLDMASCRCVYGEAARFEPPLFPVTDDDFHSSLRKPVTMDGLPQNLGEGEAS